MYALQKIVFHVKTKV